SNANPAALSKNLIAQLLELDAIYVMGAVTDTSVENETAAPAYIAGNHFLLAHVDRSVNPLKPSAYRTFAWTGGTMRGVALAIFRIPVPDYGDGAIKPEIEMAWDDKVTAPELGVLLSSAV